MGAIALAIGSIIAGFVTLLGIAVCVLTEASRVEVSRGPYREVAPDDGALADD